MDGQTSLFGDAVATRRATDLDACQHAAIIATVPVGNRHTETCQFCGASRDVWEHSKGGEIVTTRGPWTGPEESAA